MGRPSWWAQREKGEKVWVEGSKASGWNSVLRLFSQVEYNDSGIVN
jgi:hypothetical protein